MALPNLPPRTAQEELGDAAKELRERLAEVLKQMAKMNKEEAPELVEQLKKIGKAADAQGPKLAKLYALDPNGVRSLRQQFQSVIDGAAEMAGKVKEKADGMHGIFGKIAEAMKGKNYGVSGAAVGSLFGPEGAAAGAIFDKVAGSVREAADALSGFAQSSVQAANPGLWQRYQRSVEDLSAVFGQAFSPVVQLALEMTDQLNGVLSEIAPVVGEIVQELVSDFKPIMEAVMSLVQSLAEAFRDVWGKAGPTFRDVIREIAAAVLLAVKAYEMLLLVMKQIGLQLRSGSGLDIGKAVADAAKEMGRLDKKARDAAQNKTFAARPAEFSGIEEIGRKAQLAAVSGGTGKSVEDNTADIVERMNALASAFGSFVSGVVAPIRVSVAAIESVVTLGHWIGPGKEAAKDAGGVAAAAGLGGG